MTTQATVTRADRVPKALLVVDDEPQILTAIEDLFEDEFEVITATDAATGLQILKERFVSVVLSDQRMPGLRGADFLAQAQSYTDASRILVTGYSDYEALIQAVNDGRIFGFVAKPWESGEFRSLVFQAHEMFELLRRLDHERRLLQGLMDHVPDQVFFKDAEFRYLRANQPLARHYGLDDATGFVGRRDSDLAPPEFADLVRRIEEAERQVLETGKARIDEVRQMPNAGGNARRWFSTTRAAIRDGQDRVTGLVGISRDITDRRRADEEVRLNLSLQRVRTAVMAMHESDDWSIVLECFRTELGRFVDFLDCSLYLVQEDGTCLEGRASAGFRLREVDAPESVRQALTFGVCRQRVPSQPAPGCAAAEGHDGAIVDVPFGTGVLVVRSSYRGAFSEDDRQVLDRFGEVLAEAHRRAVEVEALHWKDRQLQQAQKMEVVGQLTGGVAHDFGNLVTIISGNSQLLLRHLAEDEQGRALTEEIHQAGRKAETLIQRLLAVSKRQSVEPSPLDMNDVLEELLPLLDRLTGASIRIERQFAAGPLLLMGDRAQVEQILLNLVVNARDAMPRGGVLRVGTGLHEVPPDDAADVGGLPPGTYVKLIVEDTGIGMPAEVRERIFEAFYTTKAGTGTGLGLATVHSIVRQLEGTILVDSEPGAGSTFTVLVPCHKEGPTQDGPGRDAL